MSEKQQIEAKDKRIEYDNVIYLINESKNTSSVIDSKAKIYQTTIPRSIKYETKEYVVTSILDNAFNFINIKFIQFPPDSKLQTIEKYSFAYSKIKSITIPSTVTSIKERSFHYCQKLKQVEIPEDSKLQIIEKDAFSFSNIMNCIKIPSSVTLIGERAFFCCEDLRQIEIPYDSNIKEIGKDAFAYTDIRCISIPKSVTFIGKEAFFHCRNIFFMEINNADLIHSCKSAFVDLYDVTLMISND